MKSNKSIKKSAKKSMPKMAAEEECCCSGDESCSGSECCSNGFHMDKELKQGYTVFGLLIATLGLLWLANDVGWIYVGFSVGPLVVIILGLTMIFTCIEAKD